MNVTAVVVAGGSRHALDVLTPVAGVPMVVRSIRAVLASRVVDRVLLDVGVRTAAVLRLCADLDVAALDVTALDVTAWQPQFGAPRRVARAGRRAGAAVDDGGSDTVLVLDAARPLTPPGLFVAVLDGIRGGHDTVVPVLPLVDTVKLVDADGRVRGTPDRTGLRVVQAPHAFRGSVHTGLLAVPADRAAAGAPVHTVAGDPLAFPVRTPWDLELAELLIETELNVADG